MWCGASWRTGCADDDTLQIIIVITRGIKVVVMAEYHSPRQLGPLKRRKQLGDRLRAQGVSVGRQQLRRAHSPPRGSAHKRTGSEAFAHDALRSLRQSVACAAHRHALVRRD